jgi:putative peptidoglycan lipid II flippase
VWVAAGILSSRLVGLVRQRVIAHFFGQSTDAADALAAAFRIPNFLQNLFGEGVLSASLIPVYARLNATGRTDEARRVAGAVAGLLGLLVAVVVAVGVTATPLFIDVLVPGFLAPERHAARELAITLVRVLFPGVGALVFSAWCLGILNSHRRFFLSYAAPVVWNLSIVTVTLLAHFSHRGEALAVWTAWGATIGSVLQLAVQLPPALRVSGGIRWSLRTDSPEVRSVLRNFVPAFVSRGVVQISAFIDAMISSLLPVGAVAGLSNAQMLYTLPVSLLGMSVAAAELPELSTTAGEGAERHDALRQRLAAAGAQVTYFIVPSAVAFLALGHIIAGLVFQSGAFRQADAYYVWGILAGATVGLLATSLGRLLTSAYYALQDTRTPLRFALLRVVLTTGLGYVAAVHLPPILGLAPQWGTAGLTASAGVAGWVEYALLYRSLSRRIGPFPIRPGLLLRCWGAAIAAAGAGWALLQAAATWPLLVRAPLVLLLYGSLYLGLTHWMNLPEIRTITARFRRSG